MGRTVYFPHTKMMATATIKKKKRTHGNMDKFFTLARTIVLTFLIQSSSLNKLGFKILVHQTYSMLSTTEGLHNMAEGVPHLLPTEVLHIEHPVFKPLQLLYTQWKRCFCGTSFYFIPTIKWLAPTKSVLVVAKLQPNSLAWCSLFLKTPDINARNFSKTDNYKVFSKRGRSFALPGFF